jgi:hypothetical protein
MNSTRPRARHLESAVSFFLLLILFLIGLGIFVKQLYYDSDRFSIQPRLDAPSSLISDTFTPAGFKTLSKTETHTAENLYEKIDGKAPLYTESGFEKLFTQRFISKNDPNLWVELYIFDMGKPRNAFSVHSVQRRAEAEILPDMPHGYKTSNALYFIHGKYYIELVGSAESKQLFAAMAEVADKTRSELKITEDTKIAELGLFPPENLVPGSIRLYLKNAFGYEGLINTFTCRCKIDGQTVTAFLSKQASHQAAKKMADDYYKFLIDNGAEDKGQLNWNGGRIVTLYGALELIFSNGVYVAGIHEAENIGPATKMAAILNDIINQVSKK